MKSERRKTRLWVALLLSHDFFFPVITTTKAFSTSHRQSRARVVQERIQQQQVPERNPTVNHDAQSPSSGVRYADVLTGLDRLYPPTQLDARNAASRRDGYWPYINQGQEPPEQFTYGEFDFHFFAALLDQALTMIMLEKKNSGNDDYDDVTVTFCDIGSGAGRLVVTAAALHPTWKCCRGIELLSSMHESATDIVQGNCRHVQPEEMVPNGDTVHSDDSVRQILQGEIEEEPGDLLDQPAIDKKIIGDVVSKDSSAEHGENVSFRLPLNEEMDQFLRMAAVEFVCGSFTDPYVYFGDANIIFMFSSALNEALLAELSCAIGRQCQPGTVVITTDYQLNLSGTVPAVPGDDRLAQEGKFRFELMEQIDGWCWCTGGQTTAYIHRLVESVGMPLPLARPVPTLQDVCFDVAMKFEKGEFKDDRFLLGVANNCRFYGLPEAFVPRSYR